MVWILVAIIGLAALLALMASLANSAASAAQAMAALEAARAAQTANQVSMGLIALVAVLTLAVIGLLAVMLVQRVRLERLRRAQDGGRWLPGPNARWGRAAGRALDAGRQVDPMQAMMLAVLAKMSGVELGRHETRVALEEPEADDEDAAIWWEG